jgi:hypothetical protein
MFRAHRGRHGRLLRLLDQLRPISSILLSLRFFRRRRCSRDLRMRRSWSLCRLDLIAGAFVLVLMMLLFEIEAGLSLRCHIGLGYLVDRVFLGVVLRLCLRCHIDLHLVDLVVLYLVLRLHLRCHIDLLLIPLVSLGVFLRWRLFRDKELGSDLDLMNSSDAIVLVVARGRVGDLVLVLVLVVGEQHVDLVVNRMASRQ